MNLKHTLRLLCLTLLLTSPAFAQRGGGMGMGGGRGPGMGGGGGMRDVPRGGARPGVGAGTQAAPRGRWWDDKKFAKSVGLNDDQKKRLDDVFAQNRDGLQSRFDALQQAQSKLDALKRSNHPSETALSTEIDHVAQARADLEKAYTHMLLQIRDELTPDQLSKLEESH